MARRVLRLVRVRAPWIASAVLVILALAATGGGDFPRL
jgi:hypothetical protein